MKRILILLLILAILNGCSHSTKENSSVYQSPAEKEIFKGVWIYYNEISMISEGGGTEESFRQKVNKIFSDCKNFGLNALIAPIYTPIPGRSNRLIFVFKTLASFKLAWQATIFHTITAIISKLCRRCNLFFRFLLNNG